jgi:glycosyltransferase involved in cell wall biosynthesis
MTDRLGVVGVVPFWSNSDNLNADSCYVWLRTVLPEMSRQEPDTHFVVFFPDPHYGRDKWTYQPDGLVSDHIHFISWPYDSSMAGGVVGFDSVRARVIETTFGVNLYWLVMVEMGTMLSCGYNNAYSSDGKPAIVSQHQYVIHDSLPYPTESLFSRLWLQIGGSIASDRLVYASQHCYDMAQDSFGQYVTSEVLEDLNRRSKVLLFGLLSGDETCAPKASVRHSPVMLYNHRFELYKQPKKTWEAFAALRSQGYKFDIWVTQALGQKTKDYPADKLIHAPDRADYLEHIASAAAINTINSTHETYCISVVDSMAVGHIVVLPDSVTFPELVPPDYPYLFKDEKQQVEMLGHILSTWPHEYNKWSKVLSSHARKRFNVVDYVKQYAPVLHAAENEHRQAQKKSSTQKTLDDIFGHLKVGYPYSLWGPGGLTALFNQVGHLGPQAFPVARIVREAARRDDVDIVWQDSIKLVRRK